MVMRFIFMNVSRPPFTAGAVFLAAVFVPPGGGVRSPALRCCWLAGRRTGLAETFHRRTRLDRDGGLLRRRTLDRLRSGEIARPASLGASVTF